MNEGLPQTDREGWKVTRVGASHPVGGGVVQRYEPSFVLRVDVGSMFQQVLGHLQVVVAS